MRGVLKAIAGIAVFVEEDEAAGAFAASSEELHGGLCGARGSGAGGTKEIAGGFGEDDFHDGFAVAGGGDARRFRSRRSSRSR